jgi:glycosyltransferase involved in cell wall biosynthesis
MRILLANKFLYNRGGAERWIFETDKLLQEHGHETIRFSMEHEKSIRSAPNDVFVSSVSYDRPPFHPASWKAILRMFYSGEVKHAVRQLVEKSRPDVAILGNVYHQLGPSLIGELSRLKVPMVMMLHDYKVVCPSYLMLRNGVPCGKCSHGRFFWSAVHGCGGSPANGIILALESYWQRKVVKTYSKVNTFIAPGRFLAKKSSEMGFGYPIHYVPNFVSIPQYKADPEKGRAIGFAGRISPEKGLNILLDAAALVPDVPVRIAGTGPSLEVIKKCAPSNVTFIGQLDKESLTREMLAWRAVVMPSLWYENCPYGILEAFALGLPVVGSDIGGIKELVGGYGVLFPAAEVKALARGIRELWENSERCTQLGKTAREFVAQEYSPEKFISAIMAILEEAVRQVF